MQGLIGRKIGMTRIFESDTGKAISITVVHVPENVIHQIKTVEKDGYSAVQLGFDVIPERKVNKPQLGHFKKHNSTPTRLVKEFDMGDSKDLECGKLLGVEVFSTTRIVDVTGVTQGCGFTGTVKRYGFHLGRRTHGNSNYRERGSLGAGTYPGRVFPGMKMAGQHGNEQKTIRNVVVVKVDQEKKLIFLKGSIPGKTKGIVYINKK